MRSFSAASGLDRDVVPPLAPEAFAKKLDEHISRIRCVARASRALRPLAQRLWSESIFSSGRADALR